MTFLLKKVYNLIRLVNAHKKPCTSDNHSSTIFPGKDPIPPQLNVSLSQLKLLYEPLTKDKHIRIFPCCVRPLKHKLSKIENVQYCLLAHSLTDDA